MKLSKFASRVSLLLIALMGLPLLGGCISSAQPGGGGSVPVFNPAAISSTIDAALKEVTTWETAVADTRVAMAAEAQGTDRYKSLERQLAQWEAELSMARIYLRFAQSFARTLTPPAPSAIVPATQPAG